MSWEQIRAKARRVVHDTFARDATYTPPGGGAAVPARIRLHPRFLRMGDLDREGYAQVIDDVNEVMVDTGELTPARLGRIDFGDGHKYDITSVVPDKDGPFWTCKVAPAK